MEYELITTPEGFEDLLDRIGPGSCALDFEGWNYKVRLAQFCNDKVWAVVDFGDVGPDNWFFNVAHWLEDPELELVAFYSGHELRCLYGHDSRPNVVDLAHLYKAIEGGCHLSLARLAKIELDIDMDKGNQASDWDTGELTQDQLDYAALDAKITWDIWKKLQARATDGQRKAFYLLDDMVPAVIEMETTGLKLDQVHHGKLIKQWDRLLEDRDAALRELISEESVPNLNSNKQLSDFFAKILPDEALHDWPKTETTGSLSMKNADLIVMAGYFGDNMLSTALRLLAERSTLTKYLSSFGQSLIDKANRDDDRRVRARFNIAAAVTGRFSSSNPNLQQIPRDRDFFGERLSIRQGFIPEPGNQIISYDYSGIEMVVMAIVSGDEQLFEDVIYGDVHSEAAAMIAGRKIDPKASVEDKELRQQGKPINFGIIYGTTALGLAGRQGWTFDFADDVINQWARRYPKAYNLRFEVQRVARETGYIETWDGGTIYVGKKVGLTKCANYPIQRAALSVMARAIAYHHRSLVDLRAQRPELADRIRMCATIHDALIDEAPTRIADQVMDRMKQDMLDAYRDIFPMLHDVEDDKLLEGGMGPSWGELE